MRKVRHLATGKFPCAWCLPLLVAVAPLAVTVVWLTTDSIRYMIGNLSDFPLFTPAQVGELPHAFILIPAHQDLHGSFFITVVFVTCG